MAFIYKKVGTKYICFGHGMKRIPGTFKTPRQAMAALRTAKEAYLRIHTPSLATSIAELPVSGPVIIRAINDCESLELMTQQRAINDEEDTMAKTPKSTTNTTDSITAKGIVPFNQTIISGAPTKEAKAVRAINKVKPGTVTTKTVAAPKPKGKGGNKKK